MVIPADQKYSVLFHKSLEQQRRLNRSRQRISKSFPMHTIASLFEGLPTLASRGRQSQPVTALTTDSRRVSPGALFFAMPGLRTSGELFIEEAIDRGAVGIVSEGELTKFVGVPQIQVKDVARTVAKVARRFNGYPDEQLELVGITGTNGKTTVSMLLKHLLDEPGAPAGLIGTVRYDLGARSLPSYRTTPEAIDLHALLGQMRDAGCSRGVLEVSSHAIDQHRVDSLQLDVMAFLNLSQDHLDYHGSMRRYFEAKRRVFTGETGNLPRVAVINRDDPWGRDLLDSIPPGCEILTFGESEAADIRASEIEAGPDGSAFMLHWGEDQKALVRTGILGRYNVQNILAALALAKACGSSIADLIERVNDFHGVAGRMERLYPNLPFSVLVDYAHTDDALRKACEMLREVCAGRLIVVFGCGGNRDREKRPLMTRAVMDYADSVFITADNPRKEPLSQIFGDMMAGINDPARVNFITDRRQAINLALDAAKPGDCILVAGKGHETYQEFADTIIPFDDRAVIRELLHHKRILQG